MARKCLRSNFCDTSALDNELLRRDQIWFTEKDAANATRLYPLSDFTQGNEFWSARQLSRVLEYSQYRHFLPVVERAREACRNSGREPADHFEDILNMVEIGSGAKRQIEDVRLSLLTQEVLYRTISPEVFQLAGRDEAAGGVV